MKYFKSNLIVAILLFFPFALIAQIDRKKAPKPGAAPIVKVGNPATFVLPNGLKVYVVNNNKLPKVTASLTFDFDPIIEGGKAGSSEIAGSLIGQGTKTKTKDVLDEEVDFLGANLSTSATSASVNSLSNNFPKAFALMADVVLNPAFSKNEFEKIKKRTISSLQTKKDDPNSIASTVLNKIMYGSKHPYGESANEKTVENITLEDAKKYYATYWKPNVAYLVFVGDITLATAQKLATQYFGKWQMGVVPKNTYAVPTVPAKTTVAIIDRPSAVQSVINLAAPAQLKPGSENAIPTKILSNILGGGDLSSRLNTTLREKHAFTYGAYAGVTADKLIGNFAAETSVRNEKTDSAIQDFLNEFEKIRKEPVSDEELSSMKNSLTGSFARSLEQPSTIASFALNIARYNLPKDYYQKYLSNLAAVTVGNVQQMANKYITPNNLFIVIVGNAKEIAKGLDKYGEIKYYDVDGNETKPATSKAVDPSITGESIIKKYMNAVGGDAAIMAIKDIDMSGTAKIEGAPMDFSVSQKYILPGNFSMAMAAGPMTIFSESVKGGVYNKTQQGQSIPVEEKDKEELDEEAYFVSEVFYLKNNYTYTAKSIESIDGKDAYEVEVKSAKGRVFTNYYDVETGLKIKTTHIEDGEKGEKTVLYTNFANYKSFGGVQIPTEMVSFVGIKISITLKDVKVNSGLKTEDLK